MGNRLEFKKKYLLVIQPKRREVLREAIYLGMNLNLDPPMHVVLLKDRSSGIPKIYEFVGYTLHTIPKVFWEKGKEIIIPYQHQNLSSIALNKYEEEFAEELMQKAEL